MRKRFFDYCLVTLVKLLLSSAMAWAQSGQITVSGVVTSQTDGETIIGANIIVKGTTVGTITDIDGNYSISAGVGQTLVFSYIGFETKEVKVTGSRLDVVLEEDNEALEEVVVVGYLGGLVIILIVFGREFLVFSRRLGGRLGCRLGGFC